METSLINVGAPETSFAPYLIEQSANALAWRLERKRACDRSAVERQAEMMLCASDMVYWCETWVDTYDPRFVSHGCPAQLPFALFPRQKEFLDWLQRLERTQKDGSCEKSRDTGQSWLMATYGVHALLFRPGFRMGLTSRSEDYVDKIGDMKSIFERCRFTLRNIPKWMLPPSFDFRKHDNFKRIINPDTNASIVGEIGDNAGRGDRTTIYFVDESGYIDHAERLAAALSQTTRCRIDISTANGTHTPYYKKLRSLPPEQTFRMHWADDKRKDQAWYDAECKRIGDPRMIAQELDIDHAAAAEGLEFPPEFFGDWLWFDEFPPQEEIMCRINSCDPSKGRADRPGDYSALVDLAVDRNNVLWFDADADRTRPVEPMPSNLGMRSIVGDALEMFNRTNPKAVIVEITGFQFMVAEAFFRHWTEKGVAWPPIYTVNHTTPKAQRIREGFATFLAQKRVRIRRTAGGRLLESQLREYSATPGLGNEHDDLPDAAATCVEGANYLMFGVGSVEALTR